MHQQRTSFLPYFIWFFPLLFFGYQFILRLWPGLMMQSIMAQFSIDASGFGLLAACYYYGYAGMQIPIALCLERFSVRIVLFACSVLCGLALLLFTYTNNFYLALIARFLIGAGSAVGFLGIAKVVSQWFKSEHYSQMIGVSFSLGLIGAIYSGKPLSILLANYEVPVIACFLSLIAFLIGFGALFFVKTPKNEAPKTAFHFGQFARILRSKRLWILALANLLMVGALEGFADVWGPSYLQVAYGFNKAEAALLVSFIFIGMLFGGPLLALCSKKLGNFKVLQICGLGLTLAFFLLLSGALENWWLLCVLFLILGILCCYQVLIFVTGSTLVSSENVGISIAFLNCINMFGGSFFHTLIGKMMDAFWTGAVDSQGLRIYSLNAYQYALTLIPLCSLFAVILIVYLALRIRRQARHESVEFRVA